jgi:predicted dithiol-disulfide oxidoreductase (DUF899 family)
MRLGVLLGDELRDAILDCRVFVLLWSERAAKSRWVNSEWLMALHQDRFIVPCMLDETPLPQCLQNDVALPLPRLTKDAVRRLVREIHDAGDARTPLAPAMRSEPLELTFLIAGIDQRQRQMIEALGSEQYKAASIQAALDEVMASARADWPLDPMIVNLDGFHLKNAYMLEHWGAIQAGRAPDDPLLDQAEWRFYETLSIDPTDPSALNGLGTILFFKRDLNAAEFFQVAAIAAAGATYPAAEHDLEMVRYFRASPFATEGVFTGIALPGESWRYRAARDRLLQREIALRHAMEAVAAARRELPPGGPVEQDYVFQGAGVDGAPAEVRLSELFAPGKDSLVIYSFMFPRDPGDDTPGPDEGETALLPLAERPCPSCVALLDQLDGAAEHASQHLNLAVVAKAPLPRLLTFARERGWRRLRLLSSAHNTYNADYFAETPEGVQRPMLTVFHRHRERGRDGDVIRHFWSSELFYAPTDPGQEPRHVGTLEPLWNLFDPTPEGRPVDWAEQFSYG